MLINNFKNIIFFNFVILFINKPFLSQNTIKFNLLDSFEINLSSLNTNALLDNGYTTNVYENFFFIFPTEKNCLLKYDLHNKSIGQINLESKGKKDNFKTWKIYLFKDVILAMNFEGNELRKYLWNGKLVSSIKPKLKLSKFLISHFKLLEYDEKSNLFYVAIRKKFNEDYLDKNIKKAKKYYQRIGLIGVFDSKGKLIKKIGQYDSLYHNSNYYFADFYSFNLNEKGEIILTQQLSPKIKRINVQNNEINEIELKGKHITKDLSQISKATKKLGNETYNMYQIESFAYYGVKKLTENGIYLRDYQIDYIDTTKSMLTEFTYEKSNSKLCKAMSEREIAQKNFIKNIPQYIQVFNINSSYIYFDSLSPFNGSLYKNATSEYVWSGKFKKDNIIMLYKYEFNEN
jgi:hypothetical protein